MNKYFFLGILLLFSVFISNTSCKKKKDDPIVTAEPKLIFKFKFDSTQQRLNNIGQPATIPSGHAAQSPIFNGMSAHYIELAPSAFTALGTGDILYHAVETTAGGSTAIDFDSSTIATDGEQFFSIPLKNVTPGSYEYIRISLAYQNYDVKVRYTSIDFTGTIASFIGFNTYIRTYKPKAINVTLNTNKLQGYWAFEAFGIVTEGQAPAGATTVPNPIFASSPIPSGSCVVTGPFDGAPLQITGIETKDIIVTVSLSTNKSFEWIDNGDGIYEPDNGTDVVVDMGVRGLIPFIQY